MKYCQNCGNSASDEAGYCSVCGTTFDDTRPGAQVSRETVYVYEKIPTPEPTPVQEERVPTKEIVENKTTAQKKTKAKKVSTKNNAKDDSKSNTLTPTGWKCLTVIIIACLLFYVFLFNSLDKMADRNSNSTITEVESTNASNEVMGEKADSKKDSFERIETTEEASDNSSESQTTSTDSTTENIETSSTENTSNLSDTTKETLDELNDSWNEIKESAYEVWGEIKDTWNSAVND